VKFYLVGILVLLFTFSSAFAQSLSGYDVSPFAGVHSAEMQPAAIEGLPNKIEIGIIGAGSTVLGKSFFPNLSILNNISSENVFSYLGLLKLVSTESFTRYTVAFPSIAYQIQNGDALSFRINMRSFIYSKYSGLNIKGLIQGIQDESWVDRTYSNQFARLSLLSWTEFAGTYGKQFELTNGSKIKAGVTLKFLQGLGDARYNFGTIEYQTSGDSLLNYLNMDVNYAYNDQIEELISNEGFRFFGSGGVGVDFGATWEWQGNNPDNYPNYKAKIGASITDVGTIFFKYAKQNLLSVQITDLSTSTFSGITSPTELIDSIDRVLDVSTTKNDGRYQLSLPTSLNINADYQIKNDFYASINQRLTFIKHPQETGKYDHIYTLVVTPRYDNYEHGIYLPIQYSNFNGMDLGLSLRWKGIALGSSNIISRWTKPDNKILGDVFLMTKIRIK